MFTDQQIEEIDRLLRSGMTREKIAARMGVTRQTFELRIARAGMGIVQCLVPRDELTPARDTDDALPTAA